MRQNRYPTKQWALANLAAGNDMKAGRFWVLTMALVAVLMTGARAQDASISPLSPPAATQANANEPATALSLKQAVAIALEKNPLRKAAVAEQKAAGADVLQARSALLPRLMFSETATRGNDPVYAFGTRLRQARFTADDFALNRLNYPLPIGNFTTRLGGQWNLFDSFASWINVTRAERMRQAAGQQVQRTDQETIFRVVQAYYGLLLSMKQQDLAEQTFKTAQAIADNAHNRFQSGLVVESDYLAAQVNAAARQQELIRATNGVAVAQAQLATALGVAADTRYRPDAAVAERPLPQTPLPDAEKTALAERPDLKQVQLQEAATGEGVKMAKAAFGPRLNAFAGWELDNPTLFAGGGGNNWVGGLELQFDLFSGGQKTAQLTHAKAMQERIAALREAAANGVRLDVRKAWYDSDAARQQVEVARSSVQQSEESLRINQNRYDSGLTTITDLLRAEDAARKSRTDYWQAVYAYRTAFANLQLAMGTLNPNSPAVQ